MDKRVTVLISRKDGSFFEYDNSYPLLVQWKDREKVFLIMLVSRDSYNEELSNWGGIPLSSGYPHLWMIGKFQRIRLDGAEEYEKELTLSNPLIEENADGKGI